MRQLFAIAALCLVGAGAAFADSAPVVATNRPNTASPRLILSLTPSSIALAGDVASYSHAETLSRLAGDHFPDRSIDARLEPAPVADADWQVLTLAAIFVLAETSSGRLMLAPDSLEFDGIVDGDTSLLRTRVLRVESAARPGFRSRVSLHDLDRSLTPARACRRMFRALANEGIRFQFGTTELSPSAHAVLDRYVEFARDCPDAALSVSGHTDNSGDEALNLYLSEQRAAAVREYLVTAGIDPARVTALGKGSTEPIADNATPWGRSRNRRIELELAP